MKKLHQEFPAGNGIQVHCISLRVRINEARDSSPLIRRPWIAPAHQNSEGEACCLEELTNT